MNEMSIQTYSLSYLEINRSVSSQTFGQNESTNNSETEVLRFSQITYTDFRFRIQTSSGKNFQRQADRLDSAIREQFSQVESAVAEMPESSLEALISKDGFWGIKQTSARIAEFVLNGAGDDIEKLRAGREGVLRGFREAEKIWGGSLPEISYSTLEAALEQIDKKIYALDGTVLELTA